MASRNSRSRRSSWLPTIFKTLLLTTFGSGAGGYFYRDFPIVGPIVDSILAGDEAGPDPSGIAQGGPSQVDSSQESPSQTGPNNPPSNRPSFKDRIVDALTGSDSTSDRSVQGQLASAQSQPTRSTSTQSAATQSATGRPSDRILIATFNIQVFGESKLSKPEVVNVLADAVRQFDVVAIQEIRAQSDEILPRFIEAINADGSQYSFLIGPRLGRTISTEQYAFVYDTTRIEHDPYAYGSMTDANDLLHREPFVARFRARTSSPDQAFTFWLVNIHTDPDEVPAEISALSQVFPVMQAARPDEDDVILLGDLNASEFEFDDLGRLPGMTWVVTGAMTNTRQTKAYDNIMFDRRFTGEYTGRWGVMDIERIFGITREQAIEVSDHLPVWAEFSTWESPQSRASLEDSSIR
ncbi:endonuclease/exonuclease/phosphatase family protein [Rubripirellula reticaptiva]|uniref:Endonuclease/Exonuclease/phosphatase family protein n=1 Tax=Rubripirellula reticaptiva TaxID=2528013 RepID=A0A5C6EIW8_9BACT|nr:endonuclease/exonuclease/phosphatase family protein [Rubripirellula reticaptiva]TWU48444.1 Endonuclease/Exonuclease/phosphatase family protein [Rubripirellula reticaptiva]